MTKMRLSTVCMHLALPNCDLARLLCHLDRTTTCSAFNSSARQPCLHNILLMSLDYIGFAV